MSSLRVPVCGYVNQSFLSGENYETARTQHFLDSRLPLLTQAPEVRCQKHPGNALASPRTIKLQINKVPLL